VPAQPRHDASQDPQQVWTEVPVVDALQERDCFPQRGFCALRVSAELMDEPDAGGGIREVLVVVELL
jgi:hypothetical protein